MVPTADDVRRVLRAHLPHQPTATITLLGDGLDNVAFEVDGTLVVRFAKDPDPVLVRQETAVLAVAGRVAALETVLSRCGRPDLQDRALFYARCGALEDLAYGLGAGRDAYVDTARDALSRLFP